MLRNLQKWSSARADRDVQPPKKRRGAPRGTRTSTWHTVVFSPEGNSDEKPATPHDAYGGDEMGEEEALTLNAGLMAFDSRELLISDKYETYSVETSSLWSASLLGEVSDTGRFRARGRPRCVADADTRR